MQFSKSEAIRFGWETVTKNLSFFIPLVLIVFGVEALISFTQSQVAESDRLMSFIFSILGWVVSSIFAIGQIRIALKFVGGKKASFSELYERYKYVLNYMAGSLLYGLIVGVGLILLIIPGIIWGIKFSYYGYFIAEHGMNPFDALKKSWEITKGVKWNLFLFGLLLGLINILGALALVIGLLITIPVTNVAQAYVFRKLEGSR